MKFEVHVNPIMQKPAPLPVIIYQWIHQKVFLAVYM